MRLPEYLKLLSPVGETLEAVEEGVAALAAATERENQRLTVDKADGEGLSLWEADFGLTDGAGMDEEQRRQRVRAAMAGGQAVTGAYLASLCVSVGGADRGEVWEDFSAYSLAVSAVTVNRLPGEMAVLRQTVERQRPAHLMVRVTPCGETGGEARLHLALHGGVYVELWGRAE